MTQTVFIIDDDEAVRDSLSLLLETHDYNVQMFETGDAFIAAGLAAINGPILLDVRMPGRSGLDILKEAIAHRPELQIIMMSGHGDIAMAVRALKNGALDFIEKPFQSKDILFALSKAQQHLQAASPALPLTDAQAARQQDARDMLAKLTPRESEIVAHLVNGDPNKIIAHKLGISVRTVETHRAHIMTKLGAKSLSDVVKLSLACD